MANSGKKNKVFSFIFINIGKRVKTVKANKEVANSGQYSIQKKIVAEAELSADYYPYVVWYFNISINNRIIIHTNLIINYL